MGLKCPLYYQSQVVSRTITPETVLQQKFYRFVHLLKPLQRCLTCNKNAQLNQCNMEHLLQKFETLFAIPYAEKYIENLNTIEWIMEANRKFNEYYTIPHKYRIGKVSFATTVTIIDSIKGEKVLLYCRNWKHFKWIIYLFIICMDISLKIHHKHFVLFAQKKSEITCL